MAEEILADENAQLSNFDEKDIFSSSVWSPNPSGKNQYPSCPKRDDPELRDIICKYDRLGIKDPKHIRAMLRAEYGIDQISERTISRRRRDYHLKSSHQTTQELPETTKRQFVLDELERDPLHRKGPDIIKESIRLNTGFDLTRDYVTYIMRIFAPEGFELRDPTSKKLRRGKLISIGPHEEWSGDGHDKLVGIGFPVYGIRDKWSGKWLGLWVVPNNRLANVVAYLWLCVMEQLKGMPIQSTTDRGSETTEIYGIVNALSARELFGNDLAIEEIPAHRFLKSVHNITIERGWLRLRLQWGDNIVYWWNQGELLGIYKPDDPRHQTLAAWLWSTLIQGEQFNSHRVRYDKKKFLPSGISPMEAMARYEDFGAEYCLQLVDINIIKEIKQKLGGEELLQFVNKDVALHCEAMYCALGSPGVTLNNAWHVFSDMLPLVFEDVN